MADNVYALYVGQSYIYYALRSGEWRVVNAAKPMCSYCHELVAVGCECYVVGDRQLHLQEVLLKCSLNCHPAALKECCCYWNDCRRIWRRGKAWTRRVKHEDDVSALD